MCVDLLVPPELDFRCPGPFHPFHPAGNRWSLLLEGTCFCFFFGGGRGFKGRQKENHLGRVDNNLSAAVVFFSPRGPAGGRAAGHGGHEFAGAAAGGAGNGAGGVPAEQGGRPPGERLVKSASCTPRNV